MRYGKIILSLFLLVGLASPVLAVPITNTANDGIEDLSNGSVYGYYQNSGELLFTQQGNNSGSFEANLVQYMYDKYDIELTSTGSTAFFSQDGNSGTWQTTSPLGPDGTISYYVVKAGNYFAMYEVDPAAASGSWSTYDIWKLGVPGTGGNDGLTISHFTGYNANASVPEATTLLLMGFGLVGLAGVARRLEK